MMRKLRRFGVLFADRRVPAQPVDVHDVAERLVDRVAAGPLDGIEEFGGPETLDLGAGRADLVAGDAGRAGPDPRPDRARHAGRRPHHHRDAHRAADVRGVRARIARRDGNAEDRARPHPPRPARPAGGRRAGRGGPPTRPRRSTTCWSRRSTRRSPTPPRSARRTRWGMDVSANCVVVAGKRGGEVRYAACMVLATTRADVNGVVRRAAGRPQGQLRADGRGGGADRHGVRRHHADRAAGGLADPGRRAGRRARRT